MVLRESFVDLRAVLRRHVVPGGVLNDAGRLDYIVARAEAADPLDHRAVSDAVASELHTPGARLSNIGSDKIHRSLPGSRRKRGETPQGDYKELIREELEYKADIVDRAAAVLENLPVSAAARGVSGHRGRCTAGVEATHGLPRL